MSLIFSIWCYPSSIPACLLLNHCHCVSLNYDELAHFNELAVFMIDETIIATSISSVMYGSLKVHK